jgi:hypothetical protein
MEVYIILGMCIVLLLFLSTYLRLEFNRTKDKLNEEIAALKEENSKLKKALDKPKSQEFINFLSDFNNGGAILAIEPINKNDIYFHNSGK